MKEEEKLRARVHNLEVALQAMWALLKDVTPPAYSDDVTAMMEKFFNASEGLGGFQNQYFKENEDLRR